MRDAPSLNPAELIQAEGEALTRKLVEVASQAVADALAGGDHPTVESVLDALQAVAETLPAALAAALVAELPKIAEEAITRASVEIADARAESGKPYPKVEPPEPGDFSGWSATVAAALVATLVTSAKAATSPETAVTAVLDAIESDAPHHIGVLAETASARAVNDAREATFRANSDIIRKLHFTAVRDEKTSEACQHLDGVDFAVWARNIPRPPIHNGCRSFLKPITAVKRKAGATQKEIDRQNWAIFRRLEREAKAAEAAKAEGRADEVLEVRFAPSMDAQAGEFSGYATIWNTTDNHKTAFAPGSLNLPAAGLPLLWSHDPTRPVGTILEARDDGRGLFVRGRLSLGTTAGQEAHALLKDRAVTGLSIGFRRLRDEAMPGGRRILAADLKEVSLVALPSNESARITEVRAHPAAPDADHCHHDGVPNTMTTKAAAASEETGTEQTTATETRAADPVAEIRSTVTAINTRIDRLEARQSRQGIVGNDNADAETETRAFSHFIRQGREALGAEEIRSLRVSDDSQGGYLAPDAFVGELLRNVVAFSPIRSVARVANTASGAVILPKRTGRLTAAWVGETADRSDTAPAYGQNRYPVHELACYVDVSNAMLEDSALDIAAELSFDFAEEFGKAEGTAFLTGSGALKPAGIMNDADITNTVSGDATKVTADGLIQLYHDLPAAYRANGAWLMNSNTVATVRKLKDSVTGAYLLLTAGIAGAPATTLLGRPVLECPDLDDIGAGKFPVVFGDFGQGYRIFDRVALSVLRDPYSQAANGMTRFHARRRLAAGVAKTEALRKLKIAAS